LTLGGLLRGSAEQRQGRGEAGTRPRRECSNGGRVQTSSGPLVERCAGKVRGPSVEGLCREGTAGRGVARSAGWHGGSVAQKGMLFLPTHPPRGVKESGGYPQTPGRGQAPCIPRWGSHGGRAARPRTEVRGMCGPRMRGQTRAGCRPMARDGLSVPTAARTSTCSATRLWRRSWIGRGLSESTAAGEGGQGHDPRSINAASIATPAPTPVATAPNTMSSMIRHLRSS